jgi:type IX secretion system PorP/SprF family membrane protein
MNTHNPKMNLRPSKPGPRAALAACAIILFLLPLSAQQTPIFTAYRDQWSLLNPAAISNNYLLNKRSMTLSATWREQWWNVPESPQTQLLNWEYVQDDFNSVWGLALLNDRTGKFGQTGLYGRYAYRLEMGRRSTHALTIGLHAGVVQYRAKVSEIEFPSPGDLLLSDQTSFRPDIGMGAFYHYSDKYYAGISVPQTFGFFTPLRQENFEIGLRRIPHFYTVIGGYWDAPWLGNTTSFIEPSLWLKFVPGGAINADVNLRAQISELVWTGAGFNLSAGAFPGAALHVEAGMLFGEQVRMTQGQFKFGVAFDLGLTHGLMREFGHSAEVNLAYSWR